MKLWRQSMRNEENQTKFLEHKKTNSERQKKFELQNKEAIKERKAIAYQKRKALRAINNIQTGKGYNGSKSSLRMASSRVHGIPQDDYKAVEVLDYLKLKRARAITDDTSDDEESGKLINTTKNLTPRTKKAKIVEEYYESDVASRQYPGKHDVVKVINVSLRSEKMLR